MEILILFLVIENIVASMLHIPQISSMIINRLVILILDIIT